MHGLSWANRGTAPAYDNWQVIQEVRNSTGSVVKSLMTRRPNRPVRAASEPRYKGSWTASVAIVNPTAMTARIQRLARISRTTDSGPQSIR